MTIDKRAHRRVPLSQTASVTTHGTTQSAVLANLSRGGAFLTGARELLAGSGVRVAFRLATGLPVTLNGKVVRNSGGIGVQFFELDDVTREILDDYLASLGAGNEAPKIDAEVSIKYRLQSQNGRMILTLSGYLERGDCLHLRELVEDEIAKAGTKDLVFIIDAMQFVCCSPEGLHEFRTWLENVAKGRNVIGGLIGPRTVGVLQLRRAVREAQVADTFMAFESNAEADEVLSDVGA